MCSFFGNYKNEIIPRIFLQDNFALSVCIRKILFSIYFILNILWRELSYFFSFDIQNWNIIGHSLVTMNYNIFSESLIISLVDRIRLFQEQKSTGFQYDYIFFIHYTVYRKASFWEELKSILEASFLGKHQGRYLVIFITLLNRRWIYYNFSWTCPWTLCFWDTILLGQCFSNITNLFECFLFCSLFQGH